MFFSGGGVEVESRQSTIFENQLSTLAGLVPIAINREPIVLPRAVAIAERIRSLVDCGH